MKFFVIKIISIFLIVNSSVLSNDLFNNLIFEEFEQYSKTNIFFENKKNNEIKHNFVEKYILNNDEVLLLYESTKSDFYCHICIPKMSWFHLKKEKNKWFIKNKIMNKETSFGSWGSFVKPELIKMKDDFFILKYDFTYSNQGLSESSILLESYSKGKFKKIFQDDLGVNDAGAYEIPENDWQGKITFIKNKSKISDLSIEKVGLKNSKIFYEKKIYKFSRGKYLLK